LLLLLYRLFKNKKINIWLKSGSTPVEPRSDHWTFSLTGSTSGPILITLGITLTHLLSLSSFQLCIFLISSTKSLFLTCFYFDFSTTPREWTRVGERSNNLLYSKLVIFSLSFMFSRTEIFWLKGKGQGREFKWNDKTCFYRKKKIKKN
jgi:hypothetical protein